VLVAAGGQEYYQVRSHLVLVTQADQGVVEPGAVLVGQAINLGFLLAKEIQVVQDHLLHPDMVEVAVEVPVPADQMELVAEVVQVVLVWPVLLLALR